MLFDCPYDIYFMPMSRGVLAFVRESFIIVLTGFGDALHLSLIIL